eukprot:scaffold100420_cov54-Phaeocystis_antarctica.AAC.3
MGPSPRSLRSQTARPQHRQGATVVRSQMAHEGDAAAEGRQGAGQGEGTWESTPSSCCAI